MQTYEPGVFIALIVGVAIAVLAVAVSALVEGRKRRKAGFGRQDANPSRLEGDAAATWIAVREARRDGGARED
jgi:hypothetical protein